MKYCFEVYEIGHKGNIFKGYRVVNAEDTEQAMLSASKNLEDNNVLCQIYIDQ